MPKPQLQQAVAMVILSNTTIIPARQCSTKQTASKLATSGSSSAAVGEMVARTTVEPTSPHGPHERRERREQTAFAVARNFYLILSYLSYCIVAIARVVVGLYMTSSAEARASAPRRRPSPFGPRCSSRACVPAPCGHRV